jgi:PAS domain S-box-containing protein
MMDTTSPEQDTPAVPDGPSALHALVECLDQCAAVEGADGRLIAVNPPFCRLLDRPEAELLGRTARDLFPGPLGDGQAADSQRVLHGERLEKEEDWPPPAGAAPSAPARTVHVRKSPIRDESGAVTAVLGVYRDVTAERRRQGEYAESLRLALMGQLVGGFVHDFHNLLTILQGNVSLLPADAPPPADVVRALEQAVDQAAEWTGQLLGLLRQERPASGPVDVNALLPDLHCLLQRALEPHVTLTFRPRSPLPPVQASRGQLMQVLLNLCLNARAAMPRGGRVELETDAIRVGEDDAGQLNGRRPGTYVRLKVSDNGVGIPPEAQPKIFQPFFTTRPAGEGTGLGLAIVQDIVRQHGGWVSCVSRVGEGSCFEVFLPIAEPVERSVVERGAWSVEREEKTSPSASRSTLLVPRSTTERSTLQEEQMTVLVADNEPTIRTVIQATLERNGYRVLLAENGRQAVDLHRQAVGQIGLVLLDDHMPLLSGTEALQEMLTLEPGLRVVLVSGYAEKDVGPEVRERLTGFLGKPFRAEQLLRAVQQALGE